MLNLKLEQIRAFLHVARKGGNRTAANTLHLSQPAITARIKNLEQVIGTELFERRDGGRHLTKQGHLLLSYAEQLEYLVGKIEENVVRSKGGQQLVRIGVSETIAQCWMSKALFELQQIHPETQVDLKIDISSRLIEALCAGELDLAIAYGASHEARLDHIGLPPIALRWFTAASDVLNVGQGAAAMFGKAVLTYPKNTLPFRKMREDVWSKVGHHVPIIPCSSLTSTLRLVADGVGVAALPDFLAAPLVKAARIAPFDPGWSPEPLTFSIHYFADPLDPVTKRVIRISESVAKRHALDTSAIDIEPRN